MAKSNKSIWNNAIILVHRVPNGQCPCVVLFETIQRKRMQMYVQITNVQACSALMMIPFYCSRHSDAFGCVCTAYTFRVFGVSERKGSFISACKSFILMNGLLLKCENFACVNDWGQGTCLLPIYFSILYKYNASRFDRKG